MILANELNFFHDHLIELLGQAGENEGKYVAIKGEEAIGPFEDYDFALDQAYTKFGIGGFLVKKLERKEAVLEFSRDLR